MHGLRSSLYLDVARKSPDLRRARSIHAETGRHPVLGPDCSGRPDDLYGWTSSPAGLCAAHVCRFSTGKFEGNILTVTTTHIKRGWLRANGAPQSDAATVTEHLIRHGDTVTILAVVNDPVYLSEPMTKTSLMFRQPVAPDAWLYACDDSEQIPGRRSEERRG